MAVGFLGALCFLVSPSVETASGRGRRFAWALACALGAALLLSNTRGAALGAAAGAGAVLLFIKGWRRWSVFALAAFAAAIAVMEGIAMASGRSLLSDLMGASQSNNQLLRLTLWSVAWSMAADHPWTGVGPGNYRTAFNDYYAGPLDGKETSWGSAHNLYLHQLAERGALGLAALALLLGALWFRALRRARENPSALNLWAFGTATAFLVMNLTEVALQVELVWMLVWSIWILAEVEHRRWKGRERPA
jgi:O-antigen ligase